MASIDKDTDSESLLHYLNDLIFSSPLNVILSIICAVLIVRLIKSSSSKSKNEEEEIKLPPPLEKHDMTLEELFKYDGRSPDGRVCIALFGNVYDCSKNSLYRPGGPYENFAGRDATRALCKFDVTAVSEEWDNHEDLSNYELSSGKEWEMQFKEKYDLIGALIKGDEEGQVSEEKEVQKEEEHEQQRENKETKEDDAF